MANKKDGFMININELKDLDSHLSGQLSLSEMLNKEIKQFMFPTFNDYINQHESNMDKILGHNAISSINNIEGITGSIALEMADLTNSFGKDSFQNIAESTLEEYERYSNLFSTHPTSELNDYFNNLISNTLGNVCIDEFSSINEQIRLLNKDSVLSSLEAELNLTEHHQHLFSNLFETPSC
ncbi:hypothetical protein L3081_25240 [Colwellia sp. MSW7]|uniref:Uncharacterized protein n=1 Tax=Colwellia maritima TaxID=2912588 RepID=A0ABS9XAU1_9GAMM|nr:hypothetical protein [Colwellia maritima]MCI2286127.1 hypothetical protein [Colwellia maritima]